MRTNKWVKIVTSACLFFSKIFLLTHRSALWGHQLCIVAVAHVVKQSTTILDSRNRNLEYMDSLLLRAKIDFLIKTKIINYLVSSFVEHGITGESNLKNQKKMFKSGQLSI